MQTCLITVLNNIRYCCDSHKKQSLYYVWPESAILADHLPPSIMTGINIAAVFACDGCDGCWSRYLLSL